MKTQYVAGRAENFIYGFLDMGPTVGRFSDQRANPPLRMGWSGERA